MTCLSLFLLVISPQGAGPSDGAAVIGGKHHNGVFARDAIPETMHVKNVGGSDGSGLCVFTSIQHAAQYQGIEGLKDFQTWMRSRPGGGYPQKVDAMIREKLGLNHGVEYVHVYGDQAVDILEVACEAGLMPAVTYGFGERYAKEGVQRIDHMVNLVHLDDQYACILDNNFPGESAYEWMPRAEFVERFAYSSQGRGEGWGIILLSGNPQPPEPN